MAVYVGGASIDENGNATGGKAGNQSGKEIRKQTYYVHSKGWRVFRAIDASKAAKIAQDMDFAIANRNIGYDQGQRNTLYSAASKVGFDCSKVDTPCETDCSALVRVCCAYAGIMLPADFRTANEPKYLLASGEFEELTGSKYTKSSDYLKAGDILCTATSGHTVVVLNNGPKAGDIPSEPVAPAKPTPIVTEMVAVMLPLLKKGDASIAVKSAQRLLQGRGYSVGSYGIDGDFGNDTLNAVKKFQQSAGLTVDGEIGKDTWTRLIVG